MSRRLPAVLVALVLSTAAARAQAVLLGEAPLKDQHFRVELDMDLAGEIKFQQAGKQVALKQTARARHEFLERALEVGPGGLVDRAARLYQSAAARIELDKEVSERKFPGDNTLAVAQRVRDKVMSYSKEPFTREELELTEHFDTLSLPGLLPGKETRVGDTWKLTSAAVQALCDLDGLIEQDFAGKLDRVEGNVAHISIKGTANGIAMGAAVKLVIQANGQFNIAGKRLVELDWKQVDQREQGPISPALKADVHIQVKRTAIEPDQAEKLSDFALVWAPTAGVPPEENVRLRYADPQARFELMHSRDWHSVGRSDRHLVLRLMERGDFVAQVTIAPWKKAEPKKHVSGEEFQDAMSSIPGWDVEAVLDKGSKIDDPRAGFWAYRTGASGTWNGVKTVQYFYMVAGPQGDQVVLTFSMAPAQAQKLNTRDLDLVRGIIFPARNASGSSSSSD